MCDEKQISETSNNEENGNNYLEDISDGDFEIDEESDAPPSNQIVFPQKGVAEFGCGSNSKFSKYSSFAHKNNNAHKQKFLQGPCRRRTRRNNRVKAIARQRDQALRELQELKESQKLQELMKKENIKKQEQDRNKMPGAANEPDAIPKIIVSLSTITQKGYIEIPCPLNKIDMQVLFTPADEGEGDKGKPNVSSTKEERN